MVDYKKIADIMDNYSSGFPWTSKEEFKELMQARKMKLIKIIDFSNDSNREVWGNKNYQIIVRHNCKCNRYKII